MDYKSALIQGYQFYGSQMVGQVDPALVPPYRASALLYEAGPSQLGFGDLTGGFMSGTTPIAQGGSVKHVIPIAYSTALLAWGFLAFPQVS